MAYGLHNQQCIFTKVVLSRTPKLQRRQLLAGSQSNKLHLRSFIGNLFVFQNEDVLLFTFLSLYEIDRNTFSANAAH